MKLSNAEMQEIDTILEKYCNTKEALSMKNFCQHGSVSTYKHVMYVTRVCYYLNKHFGLGADVKSLVVGAFLHDFYLYDWHEKDDSHKWHGFSHAHTALLNADARFALTDKERDIIAHHMCLSVCLSLTFHILPLRRWKNLSRAMLTWYYSWFGN